MQTCPPVYALTVGDATGVGPEITIKFLWRWVAKQPAYGLAVWGDLAVLQATAQQLGINGGGLPQHQALSYHHPEGCDTAFHETSARAGAIAYHAIEQAIAGIAAGHYQGLVTGPVSKAHWWQAGFEETGHTEVLQRLANQHWPSPSTWQADMLFAFGQTHLVLLTRHVPLQQVSSALSVSGVYQTLSNTARYLENQLSVTTGGRAVQLDVLGVNPHAGEIGGQEEQRVLKPAMMQLMQQERAVCRGPFPADAYFRGFRMQDPGCDAVVAVYHDQGLIPVKLLGGWQAVNVTIGLPFLRTSVSHGLAQDIAGRGIAVPDSLEAAVRYLHQQFAQRVNYSGL